MIYSSSHGSAPSGSSGGFTPNSPGRSSIALARNDYSASLVTTSAYLQLIPSMPAASSELFVFDSSGQTMYLATGASGAQINQMYIVPGGNGLVDLAIPLGSQVWIKAVSATASVGEINVTFLG